MLLDTTSALTVHMSYSYCRSLTSAVISEFLNKVFVCALR